MSKSTYEWNATRFRNIYTKLKKNWAYKKNLILHWNSVGGFYRESLLNEI